MFANEHQTFFVNFPFHDRKYDWHNFRLMSLMFQSFIHNCIGPLSRTAHYKQAKVKLCKLGELWVVIKLRVKEVLLRWKTNNWKFDLQSVNSDAKLNWIHADHLFSTSRIDLALGRPQLVNSLKKPEDAWNEEREAKRLNVLLTDESTMKRPQKQIKYWESVPSHNIRAQFLKNKLMKFHYAWNFHVI